MKDRSFLDFKVEKYVKCFGSFNSFFKKILDSLEFDFSIINVKNLEVEISNRKDFVPNAKCYDFFNKCHSKCENCPIDKVISSSKKVSRVDGKRKDYFYPIFDGSGNIASVIKYSLKDVFQRNLDKEIDDIFYRILQDSQDVVYRYDFVKDRFHYVSESVYTLLGFSLGEFVKMSYTDFLKRVHPEDSFDSCDVKNFEYSYESEYRWKCKNGKYRWFLDKRTFILNEKGDKICVVGSIKDINEEKKYLEKNEILKARIASISDSEKKVSGLTDKEKVVLWGFCRYPLFNDEELADKLGLKRSTLTAIKNRLKTGGWLKLIYIPNFNKLDCDYLGFFRFTLKKGSKKNDFDFVKDISNVILKNFEGNDFFGFFVSKKFIDFEKFIENFSEKNAELDFFYDKFFYSLENFELRDFSGLVNFVFNLKKEKAGFYNFNNHEIKLSLNEKRVLYCMACNPDFNSAEIAKKIWISNPTVIKIRKRFLEEKIIYPYVVVNPIKLGFNFIVRFSYEFDGEVPKNLVRDEFDFKVFLHIKGKRKITDFVFFENERKYLQEIDLIRDTYRRAGIYLKFNSEIFPIQKRGKKFFDIEDFLNDLLFEKV